MTADLVLLALGCLMGIPLGVTLHDDWLDRRSDPAWTCPRCGTGRHTTFGAYTHLKICSDSL